MIAVSALPLWIALAVVLSLIVIGLMVFAVCAVLDNKPHALTAAFMALLVGFFAVWSIQVSREYGERSVQRKIEECLAAGGIPDRGRSFDFYCHHGGR